MSKKDWEKVPDDAVKINVLMLGFDSLSHASFIRTLPHTFKYDRFLLIYFILIEYSLFTTHLILR